MGTFVGKVPQFQQILRSVLDSDMLKNNEIASTALSKPVSQTPRTAGTDLGGQGARCAPREAQGGRGGQSALRCGRRCAPALGARAAARLAVSAVPWQRATSGQSPNCS